MSQCYRCQYKKRKAEIGPNKKAYKNAIIGHTVGMNPCEICGTREEFFTYDMDRAIQVSNS